MLHPDLPLRTARLLLRAFTSDDVDAVWTYQREPAVAQYMPWEPRDREQCAAAVEQMARETTLAQEGDCLCLAAVRRDSGILVGQVELVWVSEHHREGEIGYVLDPRHHGRGFATEAAHAMLRVGFEQLGLHRVVGRCLAPNTASAALLQRLGMRREAHFRRNALVKGDWTDELVFAVLRDDWPAGALGS
jgi:RimJ/RimL family protein N-acetyltransferase